jgi:branched-chain amino acid transport system ATP-binding protein
MPSEAPLLRATDVHKHFGGLHAVDGMDLAVAPGSLTGIIGPNGAGKSTFFNVLAGYFPATSGRIEYDGRDVTRLSAHRRARLGLVRTFQLTRPFARMTVLENTMLGGQRQLGERLWAPLFAGPRVREEDERVRAKAIETLEFLEIRHMADEFAGSMSGGQKKLLEIARALMADPKLILLDEPMAGVNPTLAKKIMEKIETLRRERGITFVLIEHDLETVFRHCSPIYVMAEGKELAVGDAADIRANRQVVDAYLGG